MIPSIVVLPVLALTLAQTPQGMDSLSALATHGSDSALAQAVRERPVEARGAFERLVYDAGHGPDSAAAMAAAERLAGAVAVAWNDSFLVRRVTRVRSLTPVAWRATVEAESLWATGVANFRVGRIDVAMRLWREGSQRFEMLGDTSGVARALATVGLGFAIAQEYDSALAYLTRTVALSDAIGDLRVLANVLGDLGELHRSMGDLRKASESFTRAQAIMERIGDAEGLGLMNGMIGLIAWTEGDLPKARRAYEAGLATGRRTKNADFVPDYLSSLGGVAADAGDYGDATAFLEEAIATHRSQGNLLEAAETQLRLGAVALRRGDYPSALRTYSEAALTFQRIRPTASVGEGYEIAARSALARARAGMGDLQGARTELARAEEIARRLGGEKFRESLAELALARGDLALTFNQFAEAERQYDRAQRLTRGAAAHEKRRQAQLGLATLLYSRESYHRAQTAFGQLLLIRPLDTYSAAIIRMRLGQAASRSRDTATARRAFGQALDTLRALGAVVDEAEAIWRFGDLEAASGHLPVAESLYLSGLNRLGSRSVPRVAWPLHAGLAGVLQRRGALADAAQALRAAITQIEQVSGTLRIEGQRAAFRADKWDPFVQLALVERARGRTEAAFEASEQLRARQMLDLLAQGRLAEGQSSGNLASREQDLRRHMGELAQRAESVGRGALAMRGPAPVAAGDATAAALSRAQDEYAELLTEMREGNPAYAALVRGETAPARAVMAALAPDEALLEYLVGDSTTVVFVVTADSVASLDLHVAQADLAARVDFARSALASPTDTAGRWRAPLRRLYQQLMGPVEAGGLLAGKRRLLIAPHAELHYLPFAALVRRGPPEQFLVERYVLEYVPSASVWLRLQERPEPARSGGVLAFAPRPAALPGSQAEVAAIQRAYGSRAQAFVGRVATESTFRALSPEREIVHLATHGVLNKHNPLFSFVQLGAGGGDDGRLEVHEVFGLTLNARLLVLSACETGVGAGAMADVPPGDDWIGLVQGFLYAGAGNVLATLWPVSDVATAHLIERFYDRLAAGQPEAEALALAQRAAVRDPGTSHPFFWAAFSLVRGR